MVCAHIDFWYVSFQCVIVCLESKDYIQIRNSLIVLKEILPHFPKVTNLAQAVERWIERVRMDEKDKRQDLFAIATSYIGQLKARWSSLVAEDEFHEKVSNPEKPAKSSRPAKEDSSTDKNSSTPSGKEGKSKSGQAAVKSEPMDTSDGPAPQLVPTKSVESDKLPSGSGSSSGKSKKDTDSAASSPIVV